MQKRLYFGHPINVYHTELERFLLEKIAEEFPDWEIENPNQPRHDAGYQEWQEKTGRGMNYFFEVVLPECRGGVFLPFRDGAWGMGVFGEAEFLRDRGFPLWHVTVDGTILPIANLDEVSVLSVAETRLRIRTDKGIKPY